MLQAILKSVQRLSRTSALRDNPYTCIAILLMEHQLTAKIQHSYLVSCIEGSGEVGLGNVYVYFILIYKTSI